MNRLVIFTPNNARVLVNPPNFDALKALPNALVIRDGDLASLRGVPPHLWKMEEGKIAIMTELEQIARLRALSKAPADNVIRLVVHNKPVSYIWYTSAAILAALALTTLFLVYYK